MKSELFKRIISSVILFPVVLFIIIKGSYLFYFLLLLSFIVCSFEWHLMSKNKPYNFFGFVFLAVSFFFAYKLRNNIEDDYFIFLFVTIICILTDIGGYTFGKIFKGPKLTKYSPNKTYSGVIGSYVLPFTSVPILIIFDLVSEKKILILALIVFLISSVSQLGDLIISYFKRVSKLKDSGKIIPGHGGLLDRIDGMIFAYPFSYLIMLISYFNII